MGRSITSCCRPGRGSTAWLKACSLAEYPEHYAAPATSPNGCPDKGEADRRRCGPWRDDSWRRLQRFVYRDEPQTHGVAIASPAEPGRAAFEIESLTQALQIAHGARHAALRQTGTLGALEAVGRAGLIPEEDLTRARPRVRFPAHGRTSPPARAWRPRTGEDRCRRRRRECGSCAPAIGRLQIDRLPICQCWMS